MATHDERAGREVGALDEFHEVVGSCFRILQKVIHRVDDFTKIVWRNVGGHTNSDALRTVYQQVGETAGENYWFLELTRVVVDEVDGVFVDVGKHVERHRRETTFGVTRRSRWFVE